MGRSKSAAEAQPEALIVRPLIPGFQTSGYTVFVLTNPNDAPIIVSGPRLRADATDALLYPPDRPVPALGRTTTIPAFATSLQVLATYFLPRGLPSARFEWTVSTTALPAEVVVTSLDLAPSNEELRLPGGTVVPGCSSSPRRSARIVPMSAGASPTVTLTESAPAPQGLAGVFEYTTADCGTTELLRPDDFPGRFESVEWARNAVLKHRGIEIIIPGNRVSSGSATMLGLRNTTDRPATASFRINRSDRRVRLPARATAIAWIPWPRAGPHRLGFGQAIAEPSKFVVTDEPQVELPCGFPSAGTQRLSTNGWVETNDTRSPTVYRVTGGVPLRVLGYALGPC